MRIVVAPPVDGHAIATDRERVQVVVAHLDPHDVLERGRRSERVATARLVTPLDEHDAESGILGVEQSPHQREVPGLEDPHRQGRVRQEGLSGEASPRRPWLQVNQRPEPAARLCGCASEPPRTA